MTIGVGLVGFGLAGQVFHAPFFAPAGLAFRAAVTSKPGALAARYPAAEAVPDIDTLLAREDVDLVVVAAPNIEHAPIARRALEAGRHVLVDKPFTITSADADMLIALANARGLVLSVYQNRRWDADFLTLRREIAGGRLGEIVAFESRYDRYKAAGLREWRGRALPGSGLLYDLGPHLVDQALVLFGMPDWLTADLATQVEGGAIDDAFLIRMGKGQLRITLTAGTLVAAHATRFAVHGRKGSFVKTGMDVQEDLLRAGTSPTEPGFGIEPESQWATFVPADGGAAEPVPSETGRYLTFYEKLREAIETGGPPPVEAKDARDVIRLVEAAHASDAEGRRIALAD